jgi:hypothetical protein
METFDSASIPFYSAMAVATIYAAYLARHEWAELWRAVKAKYARR